MDDPERGSVMEDRYELHTYSHDKDTGYKNGNYSLERIENASSTYASTDIDNLDNIVKKNETKTVTDTQDNDLKYDSSCLENEDYNTNCLESDLGHLADGNTASDMMSYHDLDITSKFQTDHWKYLASGQSLVHNLPNLEDTVFFATSKPAMVTGNPRVSNDICDLTEQSVQIESKNCHDRVSDATFLGIEQNAAVKLVYGLTLENKMTAVECQPIEVNGPRDTDEGINVKETEGEEHQHEEEDLNTLSRRIAKKSDQSSSRLYMLCNVMDEDYEFGQEEAFTPPQPECNGSGPLQAKQPETMQEVKLTVSKHNSDNNNVTRMVGENEFTPVQPEIALVKRVVSERGPMATSVTLVGGQADMPSGIQDGMHHHHATHSSQKFLQTGNGMQSMEDVEQTFVMNSMLQAIEDGNLKHMEDILTASSNFNVNQYNRDNKTLLHYATFHGNLECVRVLLSHGSSLNVQDKRLSTSLHLACRQRYVSIALLLLHAGCGFDTMDCINETPLHAASQEGLLPVVQTLCAYGCQVDIVNKSGLTPLHLAARHGHIEVVRCLLLSGSESELPNKDGVNSEIIALAQGHCDTADLLSRLKPEKRDICIKQLIPTSQLLSRIKIKIFGSSGVGKTTLINSLKCGYLGSFFRKTWMTTSKAANSRKHQDQEGGAFPRQNSSFAQLSFKLAHEGYTQGIDVQQVNISGGAADISIWEFSGFEPYYVMYDHFIGDPNCVHVIVFNLEDSQDVQLSQILFWLSFIKARVAPMEPIGPAGRLPWPAHVLLIATHGDKVDCDKNHNGKLEHVDANILLATVREKFQADLHLQDEVIITDAHQAISPDMKAFRNKLAEMKCQIIQFLPGSSGFLEATVTALATWRNSLTDYPVVSWSVFVDHVRSKVNLLASEEHLKELMCQLQLIGEVIYIETEGEQDLVVLNPRWLCHDVIGLLLSYNQLRHVRPTGCFSVDEFQLICPETDAKDMLVILEALELCTRCAVDGEVEYEFPCLNFVEMIPGLWEYDDTRISDPIYGGIRIQCPRDMNNQLLHVFPRIQIQLRRYVLSDVVRPESDLYQWYHGSKFCSGQMECLITLSCSEQVVELKFRGPHKLHTNLYYFLEDICDIVLDVIEDSCPGICLEKYILSARQLKLHSSSVYAYAPKDILLAQLHGATSIELEGDLEDFINLIAFGSEEIWKKMTPGIDLHCHYLSIHARRRLSMLLDPPDPTGRDWCLVAVFLGLTNDLPRVDQNVSQVVRSKTDTILDMWAQYKSSTIGVVIHKLIELGREDAADMLLTVSPLYHIIQDIDDRANNQQIQFNSENTSSIFSR